MLHFLFSPHNHHWYSVMYSISTLHNHHIQTFGLNAKMIVPSYVPHINSLAEVTTVYSHKIAGLILTGHGEHGENHSLKCRVFSSLFP